MSKRALIIVDVQEDFVERGKLAVSGGRRVAKRLKQYISQHGPDYDLIVTTQDWHIDPKGHFSENPNFETSWPVHCVASSSGAEILPDIREALGSVAFSSYPTPIIQVYKGMYDDGYSGFARINSQSDELSTLLRRHCVDSVDIAGIATDHCVAATAIDAAAKGFVTTVLMTYTVGVNAERVASYYQNIFPEHGIAVR